MITLVKTYVIYQPYSSIYLEYVWIKDKNDKYECQCKANYLK